MPAPTALTVAGSDSGGGAGIQADLKAFAAVGVHGASAITCVTSQHTQGVERIDPLPADAVVEQIDAVLGDLDVRAVKTGMLHTADVVQSVARRLDGTGLPVVVDPVMVATSGDALSEGDMPQALDALARVTTLITPNLDELQLLTDTEVTDLAEAREAGLDLQDSGWPAVLVKGGHLDTPEAVDLLVTEDGVQELAYPRAQGPFHGAGCTYASLIGGLFARGHGVEAAVSEARARMHRAIERAYAVGAGPRVLDALEVVEPGPPEGAALSQAAWRIAARLPLALVPEVGINIAHAPDRGQEAPVQADQVLDLSRRITRTPRGPSAPGPVVAGGSGHIARVLLAAREFRPELTCAMNLAYHPEHVQAAEEAGLTVASFERQHEPTQAGSSVSWGTQEGMKATDGQAQLVWDQGGQGKEAMMRLVAPSPEVLVERALAIAGALT